MKKLLIIGLVFLCFVSKAQNWDDSVTLAIIKEYKPPVDIQNDDKVWGRGNSKFSRNIVWLQSFMLSPHHTVKDLESVFNMWSRGGVKSYYEYNDKTQEHDIPEFELTYEYGKPDNEVYDSVVFKRLKSEGFVTAEFHADKKISSITLRVHEYELEDKIIAQLKSAGYVYNKSSTRAMNTLERRLRQQPEMQDQSAYLTNAAKHITVYIHYEGDKWYTLKMFETNKK